MVKTWCDVIGFQHMLWGVAHDCKLPRDEPFDEPGRQYLRGLRDQNGRRGAPIGDLHLLRELPICCCRKRSEQGIVRFALFGGEFPKQRRPQWIRTPGRHSMSGDTMTISVPHAGEQT
jgi:hypothetical protein